MSACIALVVAAGRGSRLGAGQPKQFRLLGGEPILRRAVLPFLEHPGIANARVIIHADDERSYRDAVTGLSLLEPVLGGPTRQESVLSGLESLAEVGPSAVLIHDAARPFVTGEVISRVIDALQRWDGAIPGLSIVDALKRVGNEADTEALMIVGTAERSGLWRAQTPQGFRYLPILQAHRRCRGLALADDAAIAEREGLPVTLVEGEEANLKVTTKDDFAFAERLLAGASETCSGSGFDVHRFGTGDKVMLCGVPVPHDRGLLGHSDADVGLHALSDALLGSIGAGDIGSHFPPSDPRWSGAPSEVFLRHAAALVRQAHGSIVNVDVTLVCERPKIGPYREIMRDRISALLNISRVRVSVKATTTEKLGFAGRGEGIAAQAIACIRLPSRD